MMNTTELEAATRAVPYPRDVPREKRVEAHREYDRQIKALEDQWAAWLYEEYSAHFASLAQHVEIFDRAWSEGHASGYFSVENEYLDLANWVERFLNL